MILDKYIDADGHISNLTIVTDFNCLCFKMQKTDKSTVSQDLLNIGETAESCPCYIPFQYC